MAQGDRSDPAPAETRRRIVQIFSNPASGSYSARRIRALSEAFRQQGATVIETLCNADPPAIAEKADHICIAGGDGTVRDVVSAVARSGRSTELSIYPMGTINLLAREGGTHCGAMGGRELRPLSRAACPSDRLNPG